MTELTAQKLFNDTYTHLINQGRVAREPGRIPMCAYRAPDGSKCAFGVHITDDEYSEAMEGRPAYAVIMDFKLHRFDKFTNLIGELQDAHDNNRRYTESPELDFDKLRRNFDEIAGRYSLSKDVLK